MSYFISVPLSKQKPNSGMLRNRVVLINQKTKEVTSFQIGLATDWEYYISRGYTHWIKGVSKKQMSLLINH